MNQTSTDREATCTDCAASIVEFDVDVFSWPVRLDDHDLPVTADLMSLVREYRVWENHGPRLGWTPKYTAERSWRPIRATHRCPGSTNPPIFTGAINDRPANEGGKQQHKNKKENRT